MDVFYQLKETIKGKQIKIAFLEGADPRVINAVARLKKEELLEPVLLGDEVKIMKTAGEVSIDLDGIQIIDPARYEAMDEMVNELVEIRKGKVTKVEASELLQQENYFGAMLVKQGKVEGYVGGAVFTTGDTVRPALQIIKTRPGATLMSSSFLMIRENERYIFADCAINLEPDAQMLADIAIESAQTAKVFKIKPKVAMLSFSTKGSGAGEMVDKVREATEIVRKKAPELLIDGELQFDSAFVPEVAAQKAPDSAVAGQANVFVFPNLEAGNIGYKIAQRLGGFEAVGPILQGMAQPVSDLSRGANAEDIYKTSIITASQVLSTREE